MECEIILGIVQALYCKVVLGVPWCKLFSSGVQFAEVV